MNWLWIVVVAVLVGCMLIGRKRGLVKTIFTLFSSIFALILTSVVAPVVSRQMQDNEKLYEYIEEKVETSLQGYWEEKQDTAEQNQLIESLPLPKVIRDGLLENKNIEVYGAMAANNLEEYVVKYVTRVVINAGTFLAIFLLVHIALFVIAKILNIISKFPVLNTLNQTLGMVAGLAQGMLFLWILCIVLTIFSSTEIAKTMYEQINQSELLSWIYNHNLLLQTVTDVVKILK